MRKGVTRIFDGPVDTDGTTTDRSTFGEVGKYDKLGFYVVVDNLQGATSAHLDVYVDTSSDGINWLAARNVNQLPLHTGTSDVRVAIGSFDQQTGTFSDACRGVTRLTGTPSTGGPLLRFVRLFMIMDTAQAHVRVHLFQRDI